MTRNVELQHYCRDNGYGLERCKRKGWWMITMEQRPASEVFMALIYNLKKIGYYYFQDGIDLNGYFILINTKQ